MEKANIRVIKHKASDQIETNIKNNPNGGKEFIHFLENRLYIFSVILRNEILLIHGIFKLHYDKNKKVLFHFVK